jgi:hypothetical protein
MSFIYTHIHDDTDHEVEIDWTEVDEDTVYAIYEAKSLIEEDDDEDEGHECPVSELFRRQIEAW